MRWNAVPRSAELWYRKALYGLSDRSRSNLQVRHTAQLDWDACRKLLHHLCNPLAGVAMRETLPHSPEAGTQSNQGVSGQRIGFRQI